MADDSRMFPETAAGMFFAFITRYAGSTVFLEAA